MPHTQRLPAGTNKSRLNKPVLLIDGNNLAHFTYHTLSRNKRMTKADTQRLVEHLSSYIHNYGDSVEIELTLDHGRDEDHEVPSGLRIFTAEHPQNADQVLLDRLAFHLHEKRPCLVISGDEKDVLEPARSLGANTLKVSAFVRRVGQKNPVFRDPDDLPPILPSSIGPFFGTDQGAKSAPAPSMRLVFQKSSGHRHSTRLHKPIAHPPAFPTPSSDTATGPVQPVFAVPDPGAECLLPDGSLQAVPAEKKAETAEREPIYTLNVSGWPVEEGARFLLQAFCRKHRAEHHDLVDLNQPALKPGDLEVLAAILLETCGAEPDFAQRGSLMDKVRLALLQAGGSLTMSQLAERTGLRVTGLRGRIKEKARTWIRIE